MAEIKELIEAHKERNRRRGRAALHPPRSQFHRAINLAAKSPRLAIMLGTMTKQLPNSFYGKMEGQLMGALDYHPRIFDAIVAGKAKSRPRLDERAYRQRRRHTGCPSGRRGHLGRRGRRTRGAGRAVFLEADG